ncbi:hypothetical protein AURDEDRAFT_170219, partial [Auricularia subglabra TFB-10046 SS5]
MARGGTGVRAKAKPSIAPTRRSARLAPVEDESPAEEKEVPLRRGRSGGKLRSPTPYTSEAEAVAGDSADSDVETQAPDASYTVISDDEVQTTPPSQKKKYRAAKQNGGKQQTGHRDDSPSASEVEEDLPPVKPKASKSNATSASNIVKANSASSKSPKAVPLLDMDAPNPSPGPSTKSKSTRQAPNTDKMSKGDKARKLKTGGPAAGEHASPPAKKSVREAKATARTTGKHADKSKKAAITEDDVEAFFRPVKPFPKAGKSKPALPATVQLIEPAGNIDEDDDVIEIEAPVTKKRKAVVEPDSQMDDGAGNEGRGEQKTKAVPTARRPALQEHNAQSSKVKAAAMKDLEDRAAKMIVQVTNSKAPPRIDFTDGPVEFKGADTAKASGVVDGKRRARVEVDENEPDGEREAAADKTSTGKKRKALAMDETKAHPPRTKDKTKGDAAVKKKKKKKSGSDSRSRADNLKGDGTTRKGKKITEWRKYGSIKGSFDTYDMELNTSDSQRKSTKERDTTDLFYPIARKGYAMNTFQPSYVLVVAMPIKPELKSQIYTWASDSLIQDAPQLIGEAAHQLAHRTAHKRAHGAARVISDQNRELARLNRNGPADERRTTTKDAKSKDDGDDRTDGREEDAKDAMDVDDAPSKSSNRHKSAERVTKDANAR